MNPIDYYRKQITAGNIVEDADQLNALQHFHTLSQKLIIENKKRNRFWHFFRKPKLIKGIYLHGSVGIGKTFLMDCFYETLPFKQKLRLHFHQFMQMIHNQLTAHQGLKDPLKKIAAELASEYDLICFDELFVSDITDAMLLGRLFQALFANGVCLVATSNVAPDDLYKNGLQRLNFLPAIKLINDNTQVIHMGANTDYRLRHLQTAGVFYTPLNAENESKMENSFNTLAREVIQENGIIQINDRPVHYKKLSGDCIWFEFEDICNVPRSQKDYLWLAKQFKFVFISHIPIIDAKEKDKICLFVSLIDVLYDATTRLIFSAAEPVEQIYSRGYMVMEYARTYSRLTEMQSSQYFSND